MKITVIVEGKTEKVFLPFLRVFLGRHLTPMPAIDTQKHDGRIPKGEKLRRDVHNLLEGDSDYVIALTDVYTGSDDFKDAADAREKMRGWVDSGDRDRFFAHAAQYDFEAWLLPYWDSIQRLAGHNRSIPSGNPENVNHNKPPSYHIREIFRVGNCRDDYVKTRDAARILKDKDLSVSIRACAELRAFVETFFKLCGRESPF